MQNFKKVASAILALMIIFTSVFNVSAANQTLAEQLNSDTDYGVKFEYTDSENFSDVREQYEKNCYKSADIKSPVEVFAKDFTNSDKKIEVVKEHNGKKDVLFWEADNSFIEWNVNIPISGIYTIRMEYIATGEGVASVDRALYIDGKLPFAETARLPFYRLFKDSGKPVLNSIGDEIASDVVQYYDWQWQDFLDTDAAYDGALQFYLTEGNHTIRMESITGDLYLSKIQFCSAKELPSYEEIKAEYEAKNYKMGNGNIHFEAEGENILFKSSSTMRGTNNGDPACTPFEYGHSKINVLGGTMWQSANSAVTYSFNVDESGLYAISMRLLMNYRDGIPSYRSIAIDGEIPFSEFGAYKFVYDKKWRTEILSDDIGNPYYVYLEKGEHTLTLSVKQGDLSPVTEMMEHDSNLLSQTLLKVKMIVGQNPDINYDYELDKQIPDLIPSLKEIVSDMKWCMKEIENIADKKQSKYYQLKSFVTQFEELISDPFIIPSRISSIEEIVTTYGSWLTEMQMHPLLLDFIEIVANTENATTKNSNFFQRFYSSFLNFILSFSKDYNNVSVEIASDTEIRSTIVLWVSRGTKWCQTMKQLIESDFTPKTGIAVNLNVLPAGQLNSGGANALLLAITSGRAPDIATGVSSGSVGEFAMRNALVDLSQFSGYSDVSKQFKSEHFVPLTYNNGVYALPETQNFMCMVYRKDILSQLGLCIPNTWDELYDRIIPVLNQNNMQFYVPFTVQGYDMFLYQMGGEYYKSDLKTTALDSTMAYQALVDYTDLFSLYGVPKSANFYNRFRSGEMPIGIVDYNSYMTVKSAAADIRGKWGVALIPGHEKDNGIDRSHSVLSAECVMMMEQSDKQKDAWEFIKWWTSSDVQLEYSNRIESLLGSSARWVSANWSAFTNLSWDNDEIDVILQSFNYAKQPPVVLGGYYVSRHITNALNRVIVSGNNPRDSIEIAVDDINRELQRRRESVS